MIKTVKIDTLDGVLDLLKEQKYIESLKRYRNSYLFRGMLDSSFELVTSLRRNCKDKKQQLESSILRSFTKYAVNEDPTIGQSIWRQLILGQHYGLPTRLLDWSHSPLIALHFATAEKRIEEMSAHDCAVWRIDMIEIHNLLPEKYHQPLKREHTFVMSVDMLSETTTSLRQYDEDMGGDAMAIIEPPSVDPRIVGQYSYFSIIPNDMHDIRAFLDRNTENTVKYIIDKNLRWRVRDMLDQLNVNERIVYPGLDGLSRWIARHYYVMD